MNQSKNVSLPTQAKSYASKRTLSAVVMTLAVGGLAACSGISDVTKERVSRSSVAVQQGEQTVGRSEDGAVELQRAKENLDAAQKAVARVDDAGAQRSAALAELHAELAVAQAQSADSRRAAAEVAASTQTLRQESERASPVAR